MRNRRKSQTFFEDQFFGMDIVWKIRMYDFGKVIPNNRYIHHELKLFYRMISINLVINTDYLPLITLSRAFPSSCPLEWK